MFRRSTAPLRHDQFFVDRYDLLVRMALQITRRSREEAIDLVQDAFVRFTLTRPDLSSIRQPDAYFYTMLRNMHLSRSRRASSQLHTELSILEWDSVEAGLQALDQRAWLQARDDLRAACRYGCVRRLSSKAGSAFLLRFFHGYVPSEIARLLRATPRNVDEFLRVARAEATLYLTEPERLTFINRTAPADPQVAPRESDRERGLARERLGEPEHECDRNADLSISAFTRELQAHIFACRHGRCFTANELRGWYGPGATGTIDTAIAAQIVCCEACLRAVSDLVGLSHESTRYPTDTLGPNARGGGSGGSTPGGRSEPDAADTTRRARRVFEHRPRELRVAVNGFVLGVQRIGGDVNDGAIVVNPQEPIALIELFSEQSVCLASLDVDAPPAGAFEQTVHIELSDGRSAELSVAFTGPWPTVRAVYRDPSLAAGASPAVAADAPDVSNREPAASAPDVRRSSWSQWLRTFVSPRTRRGRLTLTAIAVWLLFFTPGTDASAASRLLNLAVRASVALMRLVKPSATPIPTPAPSKSIGSRGPIAPVGEARTPTVSPPPPTHRSTLTPLTDRAAIPLELDALTRLQRVGAYLGQEVSITRSPARIELDAVVADDERRRALLDALGTIATRQPMTLHVQTAAEMLRALPRTSQPATLSPPAPPLDFQRTRKRIPLFDMLKSYYLKAAAPDGSLAPPTDDSIDNAVARFAGRMLDRSREASMHVWAIKHFLERYPQATVQTTSRESQARWASIVRLHAEAFTREIDSIDHELRPILAPLGGDWIAAPAIDAAGAGESETDWSRILADLSTLDAARDTAMRAALALAATPDASGTNVIQSDTFWTALADSRRRATALQSRASTTH